MYRRWLALVGACLLCASVAVAQPIQSGQKATISVQDAAAIIALQGNTTVLVQVQGTWSGTLTFEGSLDGSTYTAVNLQALNANSPVSTTTGNGLWTGTVAGVNYIRVRFSSFSSGTAVVGLQTFYLAGGGGGSGGGSGTVTATQTTGTNLHMVCDAGCSSSTAPSDASTFTFASTSQSPVGGVFQTTATNNALGNGQMGAFQVTAQRAMFSNLRNASGAEVGVAATPLQVSLANTGANGTAVAVNNSGTFATQSAQSGTWTMQPGNTANSTPWLMSISQGGNTASVNGSSQLSVVCANCSGSGVSQVDNTGFTYGTTVFVPTGGVYNTAITNLTSGDAGAAALTQKRKLHVALFDSTDTAITQTAGALDINIKSGGSTTVTEAATITAGSGSVAETASVLYGFDGSTDSRLRTRAGLVNSADVGLVVRPFLPSDGTNTTPAMDAVGRPGFQKVTDGTNTRILDPCESSGATISYIPISQVGNTKLLTGTSAKKVYVCQINVVAADAENISLVEGTTGGTCGTATAAVIGGATAANGWNFAANGGIALGTGSTSFAATATNNDDLCLFQSGAGRVSGSIKVAVQ